VGPQNLNIPNKFRQEVELRILFWLQFKKGLDVCVCVLKKKKMCVRVMCDFFQPQQPKERARYPNFFHHHFYIVGYFLVFAGFELRT